MKFKWDTVRAWSWRLLQGVALLAAAAAAAYWFFAAVPVLEEKVATGELVAEVLGTGTLEARIKSTISPKIAGRLHEILVDQGEQVKAGQLLFTLDDAELKQQGEIAHATTAMWQASLARLQADQAQSIAILANAKQDFQRIQRLVQSKAVSEEEAENATERLGIAEAGLSRTIAALIEGQKQIVTAERTQAYHEARLADTRVSAPFAGLIVKRFRDPGDIGIPGSPILMLVSLDEIWISAWVDETEMSRVLPNQPARVVFRSEPGKSYPGTVSRLGREADRESREFIVDVRVESLPTNWAVGQRAEVFIKVEQKSGILIVPAKFVFYREDQAGVYVLVENKANWRAIQIGLRSTDRVEIVEGVVAGDSVVMPVTGKNVLLDNQNVKVAK